MSLLWTRITMMLKILYSLMNHKIKNAPATLNAVHFLHLSSIIFQAAYQGKLSAWEWIYSLVSISARALYVLII